MDYEKQIRLLVSENEFLQLQMEDLNNEIKKRKEEIELLVDVTESTAALGSKIDNNLLEIVQLKYNGEQATKKSVGVEMLNAELEINLFKEGKERQMAEEALKEMDSIKTNMEIISEELNEAAVLYKKVQSLKAELAEANSKSNIKEMENENLEKEVEELKKLVNMLKIRKI